MNKEVPILQQIRQRFQGAESKVTGVLIASSADAYNIQTWPTMKVEGKEYAFAIGVKANGGLFGSGPEKVSIGLDKDRIPPILLDQPLLPKPEVDQLSKVNAEYSPGQQEFVLFEALHNQLQELKPDFKCSCPTSASRNGTKYFSIQA